MPASLHTHTPGAPPFVAASASFLAWAVAGASASARLSAPPVTADRRLIPIVTTKTSERVCVGS